MADETGTGITGVVAFVVVGGADSGRDDGTEVPTTAVVAPDETVGGKTPLGTDVGPGWDEITSDVVTGAVGAVPGYEGASETADEMTEERSVVRGMSTLAVGVGRGELTPVPTPERMLETGGTPVSPMALER